MNVEEALLTFRGERICHGGKCDLGCHACTAFMVRGEVLQNLAPIIERALDTVIDQMVEYYDFTGEMPKEIRDRWHARFVVALMEKKGTGS